jgi:transposase
VNKNELPDNIEALKQLLLEKENLIRSLKDEILILRRKKFAPSSEQLKNDPQLRLFNEFEEVVPEKDSDIETESISYDRKKGRGKRVPITDDLPRVDDVIDIPESEKEGMKLIGEEISEELVIEPAKIYVRRIKKLKYATIGKSSNKKIVTAKDHNKLIPKSIASSSLIAYIIVSKFVDSLPLYRQEKIFKRICADIKRASMARWLITVSEKLMPLYNLLQETALERNYMKMDETTTQVLKEENKKATSKSYMWVRYSQGEGQPIVLYDYAPTRSGAVPLELLEGFRGVLQVDGYDGYSKACEQLKLTRAGCWDHARRKFFDASKTSGGKGPSKKVLVWIKKLYKIEERIKNFDLEQKLEIRQKESKVILEEFKAWLDEQRAKTSPKSVLGKAINYSYNEWKYLTVYVNHPEVDISNCEIENAIRPFAVGRKNWLFSASVDGANASAMFYSLVETAKANDLEPFDYINRMLDKLATAKTVEDYQNLLPLRGQFLAQA